MTNNEQFIKTKFIMEFLDFVYISSVHERNQRPFGLYQSVGYYVHISRLDKTHCRTPYKVNVKPFHTDFIIHKNIYNFAYNWTDLMELIAYICKNYKITLIEIFKNIDEIIPEIVFNNLVNLIKSSQHLNQSPRLVAYDGVDF